MAPPFRITDEILSLAGEIERLIGRIEGREATVPPPMLRKRHRVRTVHGSVAIEGNTLTEDQVTQVLAGKRVMGSRRELLEVTNANAAYERAPRFLAWRERDLLTAHGVMMEGLVAPAGRYRTTNVGVLRGTAVQHVAPPARRVPELMSSLLSWLRTSRTPVLVRSCVVHYELLFIHPFVDGNGRIARLWQLVTLLQGSPLYSYIPVESVIRERQDAYYAVLNSCDHAGNSTAFIVFALTALRDALGAAVPELRPQRSDASLRLAAGRNQLGSAWFSRARYRTLHPAISTATASRDLATGVSQSILETQGSRRLTKYRYRR